jgi:hypothetical protein
MSETYRGWEKPSGGRLSALRSGPPPPSRHTRQIGSSLSAAVAAEAGQKQIPENSCTWPTKWGKRHTRRISIAEVRVHEMPCDGPFNICFRVIWNKLPFNGSGGLITTFKSQFAHTTSPFADLTARLPLQSQSTDFHAAFAMFCPGPCDHREPPILSVRFSHAAWRFWPFPTDLRRLRELGPVRLVHGKSPSRFALYRVRTMTELHELFGLGSSKKLRSLRRATR